MIRSDRPVRLKELSNLWQESVESNVISLPFQRRFYPRFPSKSDPESDYSRWHIYAYQKCTYNSLIIAINEIIP